MQLPQVDLINSFQVGIWVLVTFLVSLFFVRMFLTPKILSIYNIRKQEFANLQEELSRLTDMVNAQQERLKILKLHLYYSSLNENWESEYDAIIRKYNHTAHHSVSLDSSIDLSDLISDCIIKIRDDNISGIDICSDTLPKKISKRKRSKIDE